MLYIIVRLLVPVYFVVMMVMWVTILADLLFQKRKRKFSEFAKRFFVSLIWPLSLVNANGRNIFINSFKKILS